MEPESPPCPTSDTATSRRPIERVFAWGFSLCCLPTFLGLLGEQVWVFELFSHFALQLSLGLVLGLFILARTRQWRFLPLPLLALTVHLFQLMPFFWPGATAAENRQSLTVLSANVFRNNDQRPELLKLIRSHDPDLVVLVETHPPWAELLEELKSTYPYHGGKIRQDAYGMMVFSKLPLKNMDFSSPKETFVPLGQMTVEAKDRELTLFAVHAKPPLGGHLAQRRNLYIQDLARRSAAAHGPVLVLGDLNLTPFSPVYRRLMQDSRLRDSGRGLGWQGTWPSQLPNFMRIPIDHGLHSRDVVTLDRHTLHLPGSDHRAVLLTVGY